MHGLSLALTGNVGWKLALVVVLALAVVPEARANSILNGGFESSSFADWLVDPAASGSLIFEGGSAHTGHAAAWFGAVGTLGDTISETFATNPGESYVMTFWLGHRAADNANVFTVLWDGLPILNLVNAGGFRYTAFTFIEQAVGTTTTLTFAGRDRLSFFLLDDVSVTSMETPEPATLFLFVAGILAMLLPYARARARARAQLLPAPLRLNR